MTTYRQAIYLAAILRAASEGKHVRRMIGKDTFSGIADAILITANGNFISRDDDIMAGLLLVKGAISEYTWPISELIAEMVTDDWTEGSNAFVITR